MDRKALIERYLEAETTPAEERELAQSFVTFPPEDGQEKAVWAMLQAVKPVQSSPVEQAGEEFGRIVRRQKVRTLRTWGLSLSGVAAAIVAVVLLTGKPETPEPQDPMTELIRQLNFLSNFNPADAENIEFKPVGDGFVMTAHFPDGQDASFLLTPLDGGKSFNLVSLNQ